MKEYIVGLPDELLIGAGEIKSFEIYCKSYVGVSFFVMQNPLINRLEAYIECDECELSKVQHGYFSAFPKARTLEITDTETRIAQVVYRDTPARKHEP